MKAEELIAQYERVADESDAIPRLRQFILELAVRGKLMPRDPVDEPAVELLKRIAAEKERLVKVGTIRKPKPVVMNGDPGFEVPENWVLVPLGEVINDHLGGGTPSKSNENYWNGSICWASVKDVGKSKYIDETADRITEDGLVNSSSNLISPGNLIVVTRMGLGKVSINRIPLAINQDLRALFVSRFISIDYCYIFLLTHGFVGTGLTVKGIKLGELLSIPFPVPPLAEQHRIVAKVEELMALCDRLEAAQAERESQRDRLVAASLYRLSHPAEDSSAEDIRKHARFFLNHLPRLTTRPEHVKQLRQTILDLAVRGKLVEQDPADEPASELLRKKFKLPDGFSRRRKIIKEASVDASEGLLSQLPNTWSYSRIQDLYKANIVIDYADGNHGSLYPRNSEFGDEGVLFVSAKDLVGGKVNWATCSRLNRERANQLTKGWAQTGDVLLTHNATVGRVAKVAEKVEPFLLGTSVTFYRLNDVALSPDYFFVVLQSPVWQAQLEAIMAQTTRNQVSIQKQAFFKIPLPPLAEQHRIVAKVDALMALCDRLEAALATADTTHQRLLEALLHEALTPGEEREAAA